MPVPVVVQDPAPYSVTGQNVSVPFPNPVVQGNLLSITITWPTTAGSVVITDNLGSNWQQVDAYAASSRAMYVFAATAAKGGACTLSIATDASRTYIGKIYETNGAIPVLDGAPIHTNAASGTSAPTGTLHTSLPNSIVFAHARASSVTAGPTAPWSSQQSGPFGCAYQVGPSGNYNATFAVTNSIWATSIYAFQAGNPPPVSPTGALIGAAGVFDSAQGITTSLTNQQSAQLNFPVTGPIFVAVSWRVANPATPTVTDNVGNIYLPLLSQATSVDSNGAANSAALFYCANPTGQLWDSSTITVSVQMSIQVNNLFICPFTLCIPATPLINPGTLLGVAYNLGTQPNPSIAMTLAEPYDTVIAICYGNGAKATVSSGWSVVQQTNSGASVLSTVPATSGAFTAAPCSYNATAKPGNVMIVFAMAPTPNIGFSVDQNGKTLPGGLTPIRPYGDTLGGIQASPVWGYPFCSGMTIRMQWSDMEPQRGVYNWTYIKGAIAQAKSVGKKIGIIVGTGAMAPDWLINSGINTFNVDQGTGIVPAPWDLDYQVMLNEFITAFAQQFDSDPTVTYISISGYGWQNGMALCRSDQDNAELYATTYNGRTGLDLLYQAFQDICQLWMLAFKKTRLVVVFYSPIYPNTRTTNLQISVPWMNWLLSIAPVGQVGTTYHNWNVSLGPTGQDITPAQLAHAITLTNPAGGQPQHAGSDQWPMVIQNGISWGLQFIEAYLAQAQGDLVAAPGGASWQYQCMLLLAAARTTRNFSPFNPPIPYVPVPIPENPFPPYTGQSQQELISVSAPAPPREDGPRCGCYLPGGQIETGTDMVPPPVKQIDIFTAQQTWPL